MIHTRIHTIILCCIFFTAGTLIPLAAQSELLKLEAIASYYGAEFNGRPTSSGEIFNMNDFTAAHRTLPFGTMLEVTNLESGKKVVVRVNDRGPFVENREIDVSKAAAESLGMIKTGTARVSIRKIAALDTIDTRVVVVAPEENESPLTNEKPAITEIEPATSNVTKAPVSENRAWRIQLGSFSKEDNATRLAIRLRKDGFNPAFEKTPTTTRVVLTGITDSALADIKGKLEKAHYADFLIRQESW